MASKTKPIYLNMKNEAAKSYSSMPVSLQKGCGSWATQRLLFREASHMCCRNISEKIIESS